MEQPINFPVVAYHPFTCVNRPFEAGLWEYTTNYSKFDQESTNFSTTEGTDYRETHNDLWTFDSTHLGVL